MRKFSIAFLRNVNPSLHSHAFKVRGHPASFLLFNTLATGERRNEVASLEHGEVGTSKHSVLCDISTGALDKKEKKARRLKADKIDCVKQDSRGREGSLHVEISTGKTKTRARGRPKASENAKKKAAAEESNYIVAGERVSELTETGVHAENAAAGKAEDIGSHVNANADMTCVHNKFSELAAKLEIHTYRCGRQWEETARELLDYGISLVHVMAMLGRCKTLSCARHCVGTSLHHFSRLGMSHKEMGRAISGWPTILNITDTMLQRKVEYFESVGICRHTLGKMISDSPLAIVNSVTVLKQHFAFWDDYLRDVEVNAAVLLSKNAHLLTYNLEKTVKRNLAYLQERGFRKRVLIKHSSLLGMTVEAFEMKAKLLEQLGLPNARERANVHAVLYGISVLNLQARFDNLISAGFSPDQVRSIVFQSPHVLSLAIENIHVKLHYALHVMNLSLDALVASPAYWTHSFENRIKCRYEVIQKLQAQGALKREVSAGYMVCMTDANFNRKFTEKLKDCVKHPGVPIV